MLRRSGFVVVWCLIGVAVGLAGVPLAPQDVLGCLLGLLIAPYLHCLGALTGWVAAARAQGFRVPVAHLGQPPAVSVHLPGTRLRVGALWWQWSVRHYDVHGPAGAARRLRVVAGSATLLAFGPVVLLSVLLHGALRVGLAVGLVLLLVNEVQLWRRPAVCSGRAGTVAPMLGRNRHEEALRMAVLPQDVPAVDRWLAEDPAGAAALLGAGDDAVADGSPDELLVHAMTTASVLLAAGEHEAALAAWLRVWWLRGTGPVGARAANNALALLLLEVEAGRPPADWAVLAESLAAVLLEAPRWRCDAHVRATVAQWFALSGRPREALDLADLAHLAGPPELVADLTVTRAWARWLLGDAEGARRELLARRTETSEASTAARRATLERLLEPVAS